jgi:hypothetical protein
VGGGCGFAVVSSLIRGIEYIWQTRSLKKFFMTGIESICGRRACSKWLKMR